LQDLQVDAALFEDSRKGELLFRCQQIAKMQAALTQLLCLEPNASSNLAHVLGEQKGSSAPVSAWAGEEEHEQDAAGIEGEGEKHEEIVVSKKATCSLAHAQQFLKCDSEHPSCLICYYSSKRVLIIMMLQLSLL
jgi:hypothetical protein